MDAHSEITRLYLDYAHGLDQKDFGLAERVFAPGCVVAGSVARGPVETYFPQIRAKVEEYGRTMHLLGQVRIDDEVGAQAASVVTYCVAYHVEPVAGGAPWVIGVAYHDTVGQIATDHGPRWRITARRVEKVWERHEV